VTATATYAASEVLKFVERYRREILCREFGWPLDAEKLSDAERIAALEWIFKRRKTKNKWARQGIRELHDTVRTIAAFMKERESGTVESVAVARLKLHKAVGRFREYIDDRGQLPCFDCEALKRELELARLENEWLSSELRERAKAATS
jgi:hypothetical protein